MKTICSKRKTGGFNFTDLMVVVVTMMLFLAVGLRWLARPWSTPTPRDTCVYYLKQVGLSFRLWANDNQESYPMAVSTNAGGSMEFNETGQVYRHFLAMSNELGSPKILVCPADTQRTNLIDWTPAFDNQNVGYFVGLEADDTKPLMILAGDRNITGGILTNGNLMLCKSNTVLSWTTAIHNGNGNIALADGSVQETSSKSLQMQFQAEMQNVTNEVIRFAIP
jgi:prepilin-type processing-associated H-X9-DG protein